MKHRKLLIGMVGLFALGIGGVFVLLNQGTQPIQNTPIVKEDLVASVGVNNAVEGAENVNLERKVEIQEDQSNKQIDQAEPQKAVVENTSSEQPNLSVPDDELQQQVELQVVPQKTTPKPDPSPISAPVSQPTPAPQSVGIININTANSGDLQQLSGIGPVLASKVIDYRKSISLFYTIEDIKKVSGIGDAIFAKNKDNITVGNVSPAPQSPPVSPPNPTPTPSSTPTPVSERININTADYEELQNITGVGEVIAQRIIDFRQANGAFQTIEEIKNVKGIGDATFEKMKPEIRV